MTEPSRLRKRSLEADAATIARAADEIDIAGCATIAYSSEDPAHPVEDLFDGRSGPGATRWMSARPDTLEHIVVEFDQHERCGRCGCCGSAGTAALARRRRGQPPRGRRGCAPLPLPRSLLPESSAGSGASSCIGFGSSSGRHACHHLLALMGCKTLPRVPVSRTRRPETASRRARA
jgi:hypothetical protein